METEAFSESVGLTENARREIAGQERYRMKKTDYITMQLATVFSKQLKTQVSSKLGCIILQLACLAITDVTS